MLMRRTPKRVLSIGPFRYAARAEPKKDPRIPGRANKKTTRQSMLPNLAWAQEPEIEIGIMIAKLVPKDR